MKKIIYSIAIFLIGTGLASAATLYFQPKNTPLLVSQEQIVTLLLDSKEPVNAVEMYVEYPENILELKSIDDGNSIISFWIQRPEIPASGKGELHLAGVIPGGFSSNQGKLISLHFVAKNPGNAVVYVKNPQALINDGQATPAKVSVDSVSFTIKEAGVGQTIPPSGELEDVTPPEIFAPTIGQDPTLFDGRYFIVFSTQDKGSGVDHYEISEEKGFLRSFFGPDESNFKIAISPYELIDQSLQSPIFIRAIDRKGNARTVFVAAEHASLFEKLLTIIICAILILLVLLGGRWFRKKRKKD